MYVDPALEGRYAQWVSVGAPSAPEHAQGAGLSWGAAGPARMGCGGARRPPAHAGPAGPAQWGASGARRASATARAQSALPALLQYALITLRCAAPVL